MKLKNKIFNYFVIPPSTSGGMPRVVLSPVTINAKVARILIERQFKKEQKPDIPRGNILHVCFDYDSQRIYVPNADDFSQNTMEMLLQAAEVRITKDFGGFSSTSPIKGSPFSSLRVRSLNSFSHAKKVVGDHYQGKIYKDLPVIEAFLSRMPNTVKTLPQEYNKEKQFLGGYIGPDVAPSISFVEEADIDGRKRREPVNLLTQSTPFILINISHSAERDEPTATEREWVVLGAYRDYLHDAKTASEEKYISKDINQFADLYAIKRYLYLGWSLEEVSSMALGQDRITNLVSLFKGIDRIMMAVESLKQEGRKDVASIPYYITFKIDESFPIKLDQITDKNTGRIRTEVQHPSLLVIEHDKRNGYVLIETPVFISPDICIKILKAKSTPFIGKYNSVVNTIDIKSIGKSYEELRRDRVQLAKIKGIVQSGLDPDSAKKLDYRGGDLASGISSVNPMVYNVRRVSDYLYAVDHIMAMCNTYKIPFKDFDIVIGPIQQVLGAGTQGGYMDANAFTKSKIKVPFEISKGVWLSPPVILINSVDNPSYAEQTETLIHEYSHYIYGIQNPNDTTEHYGSPKKGGLDYAYWYRYFTNPNERQAHRDEIKFELGLGKSYDEIIRNKVGGKITMENYPIALKFSEMVQEAVKEIEEEKNKNEEPIAERKGIGLSDKPVTEIS